MGLLDTFLQTPGLGGLLGALGGGGQNPADAIYQRNQAWAKPAQSYLTTLPAHQEQQFQNWVSQNKVPFDPSPTADYDMRGYWQGLQSKDPHAISGVNSNDNALHFSDWWKTPYHESFSNESQWALPNAPRWNDRDQLIGPDGSVVFDERSR